MTDRYASFVQSGAGRALVKRLGLPDPPRLRRHHPGDPLLPGPVLLGAATGGRLAEPIAKILTAAGVELADPAAAADADRAVRGTGVRRHRHHRLDRAAPALRLLPPAGPVGAAQRSGDRAGHPAGRSAPTPREATAQRALEGLIRSIGKEFGRGITAQLVYVTAPATPAPSPAWSRHCDSCSPAAPRTSRGR